MKAVQCPICYDPCYDPVQTRCGHKYCRPCLSQWTAEGHTSCPTCRGFITPPKTDPELASPSLGRYVAIHFLLGLHWLNPYGIGLWYYGGCHGFGLLALLPLMCWSGRFDDVISTWWDLVVHALIILVTASIAIQLLWSLGLYYTLDWIAVSFCVCFLAQVIWHRLVCPIRYNPFEQYGHTKAVQIRPRVSQRG
ncbi:hypothetical protein H257_08183 [Aphanomyces astaci]|uniref:RING-type domain-containing protein n=1 Tax=Aphanomyces astaci TaxID=112090 RepID=W4GG44_APHAT|nr:hypothetical protein H257_08183 [Aphanomyces astaci]ETV77943.1 hypothetical protein H257_08183 [Aphanomyces astaci]|eukprot:XP_009832280.1 hypothetical protein H257_08183 [Aphanomyces astaci]